MCLCRDGPKGNENKKIGAVVVVRVKKRGAVRKQNKIRSPLHCKKKEKKKRKRPLYKYTHTH
jgi:hypothetical protein